ncbi:MAG: nitronate monooxygenase [Rhodospirillales bacterium CG15_BIG_FIL_POST_REV_8_21_14_020_66_15]|nr:MAG: nitronate monooxygenase [Rhodospirillales bacterium CG15_BIG_FIL_POST_REV_8_21_14_020_66_15]
MPVNTPLMARLGLTSPVIQAPMAGGGDTPQLAGAVSEAGGLGCMGATYLTPEAFRDAAATVRGRTNRAFGVNLFAPQEVPPRPDDAGVALATVTEAGSAVDAPAPELPETMADPFARNFPVALDSGAKVFSFTFGLLPEDAVAALKARGMIVMGTATTPTEAIALERSGVDAVVAQGAEAGGHRGTFVGSFEAAMIGTMSLVPQVVNAVSVPVVASGGIMDGRGIAAALALGAQAVQMGTAFLTCDEAGVPACYKEALLSAAPDQTRVTRAFSGRPARGVQNRFMEAMEPGGDASDVLPFPWQNALTRPMRTAAARAGDAGLLSLWAGQGVGLARRRTAAELMARLAEETEAAISGIGG